MTALPPELTVARDRFTELVAEIRPELHRYCTRLVGSAIDGEDVVQESLAKAFYALALHTELPPLRPWLLRIAHNTAIDFLRRYERRFVEPVAETPEPPGDSAAAPDVLRASLSRFVALPVLQRSAVILKDVLGCSLEEIAETLATTVPAVKAALSRGRTGLRAQVVAAEVTPWRDLPETSPQERILLDRYCTLFNARDWPGVEALLSEECRLDLVAKSARRGKKQIVPYFGNYAKEDTRVAVARAEGRDVLAVYQPPSSTRPAYVIALESDGERVHLIRDYRYVKYLMNELALEEGN